MVFGLVALLASAFLLLLIFAVFSSFTFFEVGRHWPGVWAAPSFRRESQLASRGSSILRRTRYIWDNIWDNISGTRYLVQNIQDKISGTKYSGKISGTNIQDEIQDKLLCPDSKRRTEDIWDKYWEQDQDIILLSRETCATNNSHDNVQGVFLMAFPLKV